MRRRWLALAVICIPLGLATRPLKRHYDALGSVLGDALWALLVFALVGLCAPRWPVWWRVAVALGIAALVELSQLWHVGWLDALRQTRLGALAIGGSFFWGDLVCYAGGIALGAWLSRRLVER